MQNTCFIVCFIQVIIDSFYQLFIIALLSDNIDLSSGQEDSTQATHSKRNGNVWTRTSFTRQNILQTEDMIAVF